MSESSSTPVRVSWHAPTEQLTAAVSHGLMVVPEGPDVHRVFFFVEDMEQLGRMLAVVMEMGAVNAGGEPMRVALNVLRHNKMGEFRAESAGVHVTLPEEERQLVLLSLALCALARPGFRLAGLKPIQG